MRFLRSMSLQLRGVPPSDDEYAVLDALDDVPESTIDAWLNSPRIRGSGCTLSPRAPLGPPGCPARSTRASRSGARAAPLLASADRTAYRGANVACMDTPATYDPVTGAILTQEIDGVHYEGYRLITPYWAPETTIKVCAFDAQEAEVGLSGSPCNTLTSGAKTRAVAAARTCATADTGSAHNAVIDAMGKDVDMRIEAMLLEDEPYTALFDSSTGLRQRTLHTTCVIGPNVQATVRMEPLAYEDYAIPELDWTDDTWVEIALGPGARRILTSPAYLLRFQTNRARATRFYDAFLCQPFTAPAAGLPLRKMTRRTPDLQQRAWVQVLSCAP